MTLALNPMLTAANYPISLVAANCRPWDHLYASDRFLFIRGLIR